MGPENKEIKTPADLKAAFPDLVKQIEDAAAATATAAERKRIQDIEGVALAGFETIVNAAKFEKPVSAGDVATQIVAAQKKQAGEYIKNRDSDAQDSGAGNVGTGGKIEGAAGGGGASEIDAAIDRLFPETK